MNLVIWCDFVWLFGVFSFGYLAFYYVQLLESSLCVFFEKTIQIKVVFPKNCIFLQHKNIIYEIRQDFRQRQFMGCQI